MSTNIIPKPVNRRNAVAGAFAAVASTVALTAHASAGNHPASLVTKLRDIWTAYDAQCIHQSDLDAVAMKLYPPEPGTLNKWGPGWLPLPWPRNRRYYTEVDRDALASCECLVSRYVSGDLVPTFCGRIAARRDEILAALDQYAAQVKAIDEKTGLAAAEAKCAELFGIYSGLLDQIEALPNTSLEAITAKAFAYLTINPPEDFGDDDDTTDNRLLLQALTGLTSLHSA